MSLFLFDQQAKRNTWYNLALEEAICLHLRDSPFHGGIRFWRNEFSIVLGISDSAEKNIQPEILKSFRHNPIPASHSIPLVARRCSGGGTVVHSPEENLNFTIFVSSKFRPDLYPVRDSYIKLLSLVQDALHLQNIDSFLLGKSDLAVYENEEAKKISGNAQFRKKDCIAHHGTLILNKKIIELAEQCLNHPPEEPDYRQNRKHSHFLTALPSNFNEDKFKTDLWHLFAEFMGEKKIGISGLFQQNIAAKSILKTADELLIKKYNNPEYILRS